MLKNVAICKDESSCVVPESTRVDFPKKGKATLRAVDAGVVRDVVLTDIYYAPKLVISFDRLMTRGCGLKERGGQ